MIESSKQHQLDKSLWTDDDFESMVWHDCRIHAISFGDDFKLLFDIDYIFKWIQTGETYKFWIAPCTLAFENVHDISVDLEVSNSEIYIDDIMRSNPRQPQNANYIKRETEFDWMIETQQGSISFKSIGYKQFVRQIPELTHSQYLIDDNRGGISFDQKAISL